MWDGGDSLKTVKELVYDYDDYPDSPWLYGENGIELSDMQHLTEEEGTKLLDEWENDYTRIPVTPLREYAEANRDTKYPEIIHFRVFLSSFETVINSV